jgi:hypothetical protein
MPRLLSASVPLLILALTSAVPAQDKVFTSPFYPLKPKLQWKYQSGKETVTVEVDKEVSLDFTRDEKNGKPEKVTGYALKIKSSSGEVPEEVAVLSDGVYRFSLADKAIKPPLCILKFKVAKGDSWIIDSKTGGMPIRGTFVVGEERIQVTFNGKTVELETVTVTSKDFQVGNEAMHLKTWFAENLGMVKQQVRLRKQDTTLELRELRELK